MNSLVSRSIVIFLLVAFLILGGAGAGMLWIHREHSYQSELQILTLQNRALIAYESNQKDAMSLLAQYQAALEHNPNLAVGFPVNFELTLTHLRKADLFWKMGDSNDSRSEKAAAERIITSDPQVVKMLGSTSVDQLLKTMSENVRPKAVN